MIRPRWLSVVAIATLLGAGCGGGEGDGPGSPDPDAFSGDLQVFAAASLTEAFTELGRRFEADHPEVTISFNFGSSTALAEQIIQGAPADVFASADESSMSKVVDAGAASDAVIIARNRLAILVEKENPKDIGGLADLGRSDVVFVVCAPEVPCGKYAEVALRAAGVTATPASLEQNVKAVVAKVALGEADAGIVYATDVKAAADRAQGVIIDIADDPALEARYPMAVTERSNQLALAQRWNDFVRGDAGQAVMAGFGFLAP